MILYLGNTLQEPHNAALTDIGYSARLVSYVYFRKSKVNVGRYVATGLVKPGAPKQLLHSSKVAKGKTKYGDRQRAVGLLNRLEEYENYQE